MCIYRYAAIEVYRLTPALVRQRRGPHEVEHLAKSPGGVTRACLQLDGMTSSSVGADEWSPPEPPLGSLLSWRGVDGRKPAIITAGSSFQLMK